MGGRVRERWELAYQTMHRKLDHLKKLEEMELKTSPVGEAAIPNEGQMRPLSRIEDPEQRSRVWEETPDSSCNPAATPLP